MMRTPPNCATLNGKRSVGQAMRRVLQKYSGGGGEQSVTEKKWGREMCVRVHEHEILGDLLQLLHRVYVVGAEVAFDQQQVGFELGKALD